MSKNSPQTLLTRQEILDLERYKEAVVKGGMDQTHYAKLCGMAVACIELAELTDVKGCA